MPSRSRQRAKRTKFAQAIHRGVTVSTGHDNDCSEAWCEIRDSAELGHVTLEMSVSGGRGAKHAVVDVPKDGLASLFAVLNEALRVAKKEGVLAIHRTA